MGLSQSGRWAKLPTAGINALHMLNLMLRAADFYLLLLTKCSLYTVSGFGLGRSTVQMTLAAPEPMTPPRNIWIELLGTCHSRAKHHSNRVGSIYAYVLLPHIHNYVPSKDPLAPSVCMLVHYRHTSMLMFYSCNWSFHVSVVCNLACGCWTLNSNAVDTQTCAVRELPRWWASISSSESATLDIGQSQVLCISVFPSVGMFPSESVLTLSLNRSRVVKSNKRLHLQLNNDMHFNPIDSGLISFGKVMHKKRYDVTMFILQLINFVAADTLTWLKYAQNVVFRNPVVTQQQQGTNHSYVILKKWRTNVINFDPGVMIGQRLLRGWRTKKIRTFEPHHDTSSSSTHQKFEEFLKTPKLVAMHASDPFFLKQLE